MALRVCVDCGLEARTKKELEKFRAEPKSKYGRMNLCHACDNKRRRQYKREWYLANRDRILDAGKKKRRTELAYRIGAPNGRGRRKVPIAVCREVIERANGQCEMRDGRPCKGVLTLHHVDGNPENNEVSNLLLGCDFHHKSHDGKRRRPKGSLLGKNSPVQ